MTPMFDRIISVDWSGAGSETEGVDLRIALFDAQAGEPVIVDRPYQKRTVVSWSRLAFRAWIVEQLRDKRPALVAMDFGFGLPWGSDQAVFGVKGWREMIRKVAEKYEENGTARATAQAVNAEERFGGHGPYRFDDNRNDFRFYTDNGVAYYRLTELIAPQGISQWYLGSGGTVGFHTISGLAAINHLIREREGGNLDFVVWPHEDLSPDGTRHVLVESYPASALALASMAHAGQMTRTSETLGKFSRRFSRVEMTGRWVGCFRSRSSHSDASPASSSRSRLSSRDLSSA